MGEFIGHSGGGIIRDGLVFSVDAFNKIGDNVTNVKNICDPTNIGTFTNGATVANNGYIFDGTNEHLNFNSLSALVGYTGSFTFSVWINTIFVNNLANFISIDSLGFLGYYRSGSTRHWRFLVDNNGWLQSTPNLPSSPLYLVNLVGVYNSATQDRHLYIDGVLNATAGSTVAPDGGSFIDIPNPNNSAWQGYLYQALIYKKALDVDEINQNYNAIKYRFI
jgi:hypothetical protein